MNRELSKREEEVLTLLLAGHLQKQIAAILGISESRIQDIKQIIKRKWGVKTEVDFILMAMRKGYLESLKNPSDTFITYTTTSTVNDLVVYNYMPSKRNKVKVIFE